MSEKDQLWSARNIAEYAYCPRLFYLMEVEGVQCPSEDTEKGKLIHRNVDQPSAASDESEEGEPQPKVVRSLTLSSSSLQLTAKLDLAQIEGQKATPIEYRKGAPKRTSIAESLDDIDEVDHPPLSNSEPWPTDRVQAALQAVLLEEHGYSVERLAWYYHQTRQRLDIPFSEDVRKEALQILKEAKACAAGPRPLPLLNDKRCIGCSLQPLCLPDEVNMSRDSASNGSAPSVRSIWPARSDGKEIVVQSHGSRIGVQGKCLYVKDSEGRKLQEVPLAGTESVTLIGNVQISTQAVHTLSNSGIAVAYLSTAGRPVAFIDPHNTYSATLRIAQVTKFSELNGRLDVARKLVAAKIHNQRTLLMRNAEELPERVSTDMKLEQNKALRASSIESLLGHEGRAAALYFKHFHLMLRGEAAAVFEENGRNKRPPPDPINATLSFGYSMLVNECTAALRIARLDPAIGAFHTPKIGRPALALDLMEPFRPLVADSLVVSAFNRGSLTLGHFRQTTIGASMAEYGRKAFFKAYGRRLDTMVTHPVFAYRLPYRRMIHLHARLLAHWMLDEIDSPDFLTTR